MSESRTQRASIEDGGRRFSNHEIVTVAVYLLGGESHRVETEDVAIKANELAPGRFVWRRYPNQINIENIRTFLSDAKKPTNGGYLLGSGKNGWILTEKGLEFAKKRVSGLQKVDLSREPLTQKERQRLRNERTRMLASEAFLKFQTGGAGAVTLQEAEAFFRIDDYVTGTAREVKITRLRNVFGADEELGPVVKKLAEKVQGR